MTTISGTLGADVLNGFAGNDIIRGFAGSDTLSGLGGNDVVLGGDGADLVLGGSGFDTLGGGKSDDTVIGGNGADRLSGNSGNDLLLGGGGGDTLQGGAGDDNLWGALGNDALTGGAGHDVFFIGSAQGADTITDFEDGVDKIRLLDGDVLEGLSFEDLKITSSGTSTRIALNRNRPGNKRERELIAYVHNVSPTSITADDIFLPNTAPTAQDDAFSGNANAAIIGDVLADNGNGADSDIDGDPLIVAGVNGNSAAVNNPITLGSGAILTVNDNGTFNYNPNGQFDTLTGGASTTDTFTYQIGDGNGGFDTATATITINGVNDAPVAVDDAFTIREDTLSGGNVLSANPTTADSDIDGDMLTVTQVNGSAGDVGNLITLGSGAQLTLNANGTFVYDPNGAFDSITTSTTDNFSYQIGDGNSGFDTATTTITITPVNDAPTAVDDAFGTNQDTTLNDDLLAANPTTADSDPEGATLTVTQVNGVAANVDSTITLGSGAQLTVNNDGTFSYDPNGQFDTLAVGATTTESFTYQIADGNGGFDTATATVTITGVNDAPAVGTNIGLTVDEGGTGTIATANLNEGDPDDSGTGLTYTVTSGPSSGQLELSGNPGVAITSFTQADIDNNLVQYAHYGSETIADSFDFSLADGGENSVSPATGTFNITVNPVNDAPINNVPIAQTTDDLTPLVFNTANTNLISIGDVDAGGATVSVTLQVTNGTLTLGSTPAGLGITGNNSASIALSGSLSDINTAIDGLTFTPVAFALGDVTLTVTTDDLGNSPAPAQTDTDTVTITVVSSNAAPEVDLNGPAPDLGIDFSTSFTEGLGAVDIADTDSTITDADVGDNIESLTITLTNNPDGALEGLSIDGALPSGITATTNTLTQIVLTGSATPAAYTTALQQIQYNNTSENPNTTNRTVTVVANDGDANSTTATSTISVIAVNDPPSITSPSYTGNANLTLTVADGAGDLLDGATDPEGTSVSVVAETVTSAAAQATATTADDNNVTINADGSFTYEAVAGFVGNDTFVYQLQDSGSPLPAATTNVTATVTLSDLDGAGAGDNLLWFIDEDSTGDNLGTQANPFTSLAAFNAATTSTGDFIFLDTDSSDNNSDGAGAYDGGITLLDNQTLIGDGTSGTTLATLTGITLGSFNSLGSDYTAFDGSGTNPVIQNTSGNAISLGSGNTIRGVNVGDSSSLSMGFRIGRMGISGTSVGTLTISDVTINNTVGGGFEVTTGGDLSNVSLDSLSSSGDGDHGISLTNTTGNVTFNNVNINGTTGSAVELNNVAGRVTVNGAIGSTAGFADAVVDINGGSGEVNIGAAITSSIVDKAVEVTGRTGGVVTFSGNINHSAGGSTGIDVSGNSGGVINFSGATKTINSDFVTAVNLTNNSGATINFTNGGLDIDTTSGTGFSATGGGNISVTGSNNTVNTTTGTAVNIANTFISGSQGVTFQSINRNGGSNVAIDLAGTGGGAFSVTGTGSTAGSGGTIQNISNSDAITLNNTDGLVTLRNMIIQDISSSGDGSAALNTVSGVDAIHGQQVDGGLTLDNVTIQRISDSAINGSTFATGASPTIASGSPTTWNGLTITNSTFNNTNRFHLPNRADSAQEGQVVIDGLTGTVSVTNSTFQNGSYGLRFASASSGNLDITVQNSDFLELEKELTSGVNSIGGIGIEVIQRGSANVVARIGDPNETNSALGNLFENNYLASVSIQHDSASSTGNIDAVISQNTFRVNDHLTDRLGAGSFVFDFPQGGVLMNARGGDMEGIISNNTFDEVFHANGGVGQLTLITQDNSDAEFIVNNNNFRGAWDYIAEIRADGNNSGAIHWFDNTVTGFTRTLADNIGTDIQGIIQLLPYESVFVTVRNNGDLDMTIQDSDIPDHDTDFNFGSDASYDFNVNSTGGILNLELDSNATTNGFEFDQDGGTINLFRDASGSSALATVLSDNGNTGGATVSSGSVTLTNTDPTLPNITIG